MLYTPATKMALCLCFQAHRDQLDKGGMPYVFHPFHLAEQMLDEDTTVLALLHDVVEDTTVTLEELAKIFPPEIIDALALLTHDDDTPYLEYVQRIKDNPLARTVKLADLMHNTDQTRLPFHDPSAQMRWESKYRSALEILR